MRKRFYLLAATGIFLCYSGQVEPNWIQVEHHDLSVEGLEARELIIVHIADVHTTRLGPREAKTLRTIEQINPDYIFFTGDLLKSTSDVRIGLTFLSRLKAKYGVYVVPGNADAALIDSIAWKRVPKDGLTYKILMNESVDCGSFILVGIDDPVRCRHNVGEAFADVIDSKPIFVITHFHPESILQDLGQRNVDVVFSGHTHGGQVGLTAVIGLVPYAYRSKYLDGLYALNGFYLHVTKGIGTNKFPLRFLCRPAIDVFHIRGR
jgi:predicted MPP superfamily phosphohydrolase